MMTTEEEPKPAGVELLFLRKHYTRLLTDETRGCVRSTTQ